MRGTRAMLAGSGLIATLATCLQAVDTLTYVGPSGGSWHEAGNWEIAGVPAGREPSSASGDLVNLNGRNVIVTASATLSDFAAGGGTVDINSGGVLSGTGSYTVRHVTTINVNDGGQFPMGASWRLRSNVNVNQGGTASGGGSIYESVVKTLNVNGIWSPCGTSVASGLSFGIGTSSYSAKVILGATGTVILDVFGNGTNEAFAVSTTGGTTLTLNAGSIQLRPQGGYAPKTGDSFTLWTLAPGSLATVNAGSGSNISILGSACKLDTSQWATSGKVTVLGIGTAVLVR